MSEQTATEEQAAAMDAPVDREYASLEQERRLLDVNDGPREGDEVDGGDAVWSTHEKGEWIEYEGAVMPVRQ